MQYTEMIGKLGIENTPPNALHTLNWWIKNAPINNQDRILDFACSTGFSSRNICKLTNAKGIGIDISKPSIESANKLAKKDGIQHLVQYHVDNASSLNIDTNLKFTKIVAGSVFGFIEKREVALKECSRILNEKGILCISSFFFEKTPPESLLDKVERCIDYKPDYKRDYEYWKNFFLEEFDLIKEEIIKLPILTQEEIQHEIQHKLNNNLLKLSDNERLKSSKRLYEIRDTLNKLREYQGVALWIFKKKVK